MYNPKKVFDFIDQTHLTYALGKIVTDIYEYSERTDLSPLERIKHLKDARDTLNTMIRNESRKIATKPKELGTAR
jgi:hypothetical protein